MYLKKYKTFALYQDQSFGTQQKPYLFGYSELSLQGTFTLNEQNQQMYCHFCGLKGQQKVNTLGKSPCL